VVAMGSISRYIKYFMYLGLAAHAVPQFCYAILSVLVLLEIFEHLEDKEEEKRK
jgi:hypothetical protein